MRGARTGLRDADPFMMVSQVTQREWAQPENYSEARHAHSQGAHTGTGGQGTIMCASPNARPRGVGVVKHKMKENV